MALHSRLKRVNEELKAAVAQILLTELKDPRLQHGLVTVTQVAVSKDLHNALVWIGIIGTDEETKEAMAALEHSSGYIKHLLGQRIVLKYIPNLHFRLDTSERHAAHINELLHKLKVDDNKSS